MKNLSLAVHENPITRREIEDFFSFRVPLPSMLGGCVGWVAKFHWVSFAQIKKAASGMAENIDFPGMSWKARKLVEKFFFSISLCVRAWKMIFFALSVPSSLSVVFSSKNTYFHSEKSNLKSVGKILIFHQPRENKCDVEEAMWTSDVTRPKHIATSPSVMVVMERKSNENINHKARGVIEISVRGTREATNQQLAFSMITARRHGSSFFYTYF